jgi:hypothetical protein
MRGRFVDDDRKPRITFPIRLAASLRDRARFLASRDGVSLNQFINQAVAERVLRLSANDSDPGSRIRCYATREFTAYSVADLRPRTISIGDAIFAILASATHETSQVDFTLGSVGDIWYTAPRDLFLKSTRH